MTSPERTALYRCFDANDELLYIGISRDYRARWEQHRKSSPWWRNVALRTVEWFDDRVSAERAERTAIKTEGPKHNIRHARPARLAAGRPHRTLSDLYADRPLTRSQARRILAVFMRANDGDRVPALPPSETPGQPIS
ncbi:GIY-YIG nuclease family protein [Streptomyces sp. NPDC048385]|uniref:GIY-YIG nuclease family protein n=1 Tax=unclassified Streptomyces TaxID=2593676 RepID=UPI0034173BF9